MTTCDAPEDRYATDPLGVAEADRLAEVMQGLASPVRLRLLGVLRSGPATVTELCVAIDAGQASVSNHLRLMRHLGLVVGEREGRRVRYRLFDDHVSAVYDEAVRHLGHLRSQP
ncbi:ArsR/SmtB family transcription factor [Naumannella cuiyingiana]|uniref:DNA-binding transcriptional ArsR family regulator n=1 Tax=Naumannella cuiyingiana TaxID=1347891 RepID=A0A7Z0IM97_9ACTN|nr:metalloregulator ArsR/SmtB family transcription factor [Naumannella cuiyingiana]NYI72396.1 DNA-binding transcriptional ArsR family regulator [Naumannella cuiyingiana]